MLIKNGVVVSVIEKDTPKDMAKQISTSSDIIISAVGEAKFIKQDMLKDGSVVIDAGFSILDGKIVGDVDLDSVKDKVGFYKKYGFKVVDIYRNDEYKKMYLNMVHIESAKKKLKI